MTLLNEKEAAASLGVSVINLRKRRCSGQEPAFVRIGRCVRYETEILEEMVKRNTISPRIPNGASGATA